jgi:hypothetical protein
LTPRLTPRLTPILTPGFLTAIGLFITLAPAVAQDDLTAAPAQLSLQVASDPPGERCRHIDATNAAPFVPVPMHLTFHDDFDTHPLLNGKWTPHYSGGAAWPEARYWGGDGSDFKRKTSYNGEQQILAMPDAP